MLTVFCRFFNMREATAVWDHGSVADHRRKLRDSVSFEHCMEQFTAEEKINDDRLVVNETVGLLCWVT